MKKGKKRITAALIIALVILTGCGSTLDNSESKSESAYDTGGGYYASSDSAAAVTENYEYAEDDAAAAEEGYEPESGSEVMDENAASAERKLIKTVSMEVETENYEVLLGSLENLIAELGGYIEHQYQYNGSKYSGYQELRNAKLDIRIPAGHLDEFVTSVGEEGSITNKVEQVEDVTLQYVDLESRKKALLTEQERLLELLTQAESVEDIISIEQRLSEVRYELESMESQLRTLTNQINYSTVHLSIEEVRKLTPTEKATAFDKMKTGFVMTLYRIGDSIEGGFIWFVVNIPYFVIWVVVILIVLDLFRRFRRRKARREELSAEDDMRTESDMTKREAGTEIETSDKAETETEDKN